MAGTVGKFEVVVAAGFVSYSVNIRSASLRSEGFELFFRVDIQLGSRFKVRSDGGGDLSTTAGIDVVAHFGVEAGSFVHVISDVHGAAFASVTGKAFKSESEILLDLALFGFG